MPETDELTELTELDVTRLDAVVNPANGFPVLIMKALGDEPAVKAVNAVGGVDEKPDIAGAQRILIELARLIESEAAEMATGCWHEIYDIQTLAEVSCMMRCFMDNESYGADDDGEMMKSLADGLVFKAHRKFSSDERKKLAAEGNALPDGSYPIPDVDALHRAVILARSGHGDVAAAKRLIAKRARELGVANPLAEDKTQKDAPAEGATPQTSDQLTKELVEKMIEDSRTADRERIEALKAELEVVKAMPIPGNVVLSAPEATASKTAKSELVQKAAYFREQVALTTNDRETNAYYQRKLHEAEAAIAAA